MRTETRIRDETENEDRIGEDGREAGTGTGTGTGVEIRRRTPDGNGDGNGDRSEDSSGDRNGDEYNRNGNEDRIGGSERNSKKRKKSQNGCRAVWEMGETWVEKKKM